MALLGIGNRASHIVLFSLVEIIHNENLIDATLPPFYKVIPQIHNGFFLNASKQINKMSILKFK